MGNFFKKVGSFISNLLIIGLILLISTQIIMRNEQAQQQLQKIEYVFKSFLNGPTEVVEVTRHQPEKTTGMITIDLMQDLSLPQVWVLKNGERVGNFARGILIFEAAAGDLISIDATNYHKSLWFEITSLSSSIETWETGEQFRTNGNIIGLGIVEFKNKL